MTPPSLNARRAGELWDLLKTGRRFRALGQQDGFRLLRWVPMAVADLVAEWFETDLLQAAVAARGIFGTAQGPWSAGTGAVLLLNAATDPAPGGSSVTIKGGPGALTRAMADAAREAGAEIRTGAAVARVIVRDGRAAGVVLEDGTEIHGRRGRLERRSATHLPRICVDPVELDPGFLTKIRNYRMPRHGREGEPRAERRCRSFRGVEATRTPFDGRIHIGPDIDYLERAFDASKYGEISPSPYLDITFPSLHDPSLAPPGRHVMSVYMQFAPFKLARRRHGRTAARDLAPSRHAHPGALRARHRAARRAPQVITPLDLEDTYGLTGGHILHGEPSLDQLFTMRPMLGWAQYRTPIDGCTSAAPARIPAAA